MKKFKTLLSIVLTLALVASLGFAAIAAEPETKAIIDTENNVGIVDMTHLDVKADAVYIATIDGEQVVLTGTLDPESIVVSVVAPGASIVYNFANYDYLTLTEAGRTEYRIVLDGTDGNLLNLINWDGISFAMKNVYVSGRLVLADVPEVLADSLDKTEDGEVYVDLVNELYTGIQECTSHNGLRSEGNKGVISGVDLYLSVVGISVETPEEPTEAPTEPEEPTEEPTVPATPLEPAKPVCPGHPECPGIPECPGHPECPGFPECPDHPEKPEDPSEPETTVPEDPTEEPEDPTEEPEDPTEEPEDPTEEPEDPTEPEETTVPEDPSEPETTVPEETTAPEEPSEPETTVPTDDVPDTGDNSKLNLMLVLMSVSFVGIVVTLVAGNKLQYVGKREK